jgi:hypothetical protein
MWKSTALAIIFAVPVVSNTDCGGCDPSGGNGGTDDTGVDDTGVDDTGDTDPVDCTIYTGQAGDFAATPRTEWQLELLAIELVPDLTADSTVHGRLVSDIEALWVHEPLIDGITYRPDHNGTQIVVGGDAATLQAMGNGTYTDWDCANDWYEMVDVRQHTSTVVVEFEGTYDLQRIADEYANFPGISWAEPDFLIGDGSTVCATIDGDTYHYVFDKASGDCPSGCINHRYYYFTTDLAGTITEHGSWSNTSPSDPPDWVANYGC